MRVITGNAKGAKLTTLEGMDLRPTTERVKEAVFSTIQFEIEGRRVLDLFAGSGQLGIEALSRGAQSAVFVDANKQAVAVIKENLTHVKLPEQATVISGDSIAYLGHANAVFDIVFIDPPYSKSLASAALPLAAALMSPQGVLICETARNDPMPQSAGAFELIQKRNYGKTAISIYRAKNIE
jgi:16S rRNA (guanine966-N2)-methyltransferase